ncbi:MULTISPECIES: YdcF family protein [Rhodomicrobium]|uniref:YdcF family protein n=1 Tax=Rhodomicrobium TaxID=1068 RepID=UPI000B4B5CA1|nr:MULTISPECIES: YdcF family protein [Rhodomicrobium]
MFFYASKVIWYFLQPSTFLILLFALGFVLYWRGRTRAGIRVLLATVLIYAVAGLSPLANAMMYGLERIYTRPGMDALDRVDGIIVLGGVIDALVSSTRDEIALNEAAERLTETAALAYRFPAARIVISGGDGALIYTSSSEAEIAKRFFTRIGIDPARITLEPASRTTSENAAFAKRLVDPKPGERWLLVTSAFHMPRAMAVFRAEGFDVKPWPVDFRTRGPEDLLRFSPRPSTAWRRIDLAAKEWMGLMAYWVTGRLG